MRLYQCPDISSGGQFAELSGLVPGARDFTVSQNNAEFPNPMITKTSQPLQPRHAILSHTRGAAYEEVSFRDLQHRTDTAVAKAGFFFQKYDSVATKQCVVASRMCG